MLITLFQHSHDATPPLVIGVNEDRADEVIHALQTQGWRVISSVYEAPSAVADCLQVALLEVSALANGTPLRTAVERAASLATLHTPIRDTCLKDHARFSRSLVAVPIAQPRRPRRPQR
jgi:hypothetical protein